MLYPIAIYLRRIVAKCALATYLSLGGQPFAKWHNSICLAPSGVYIALFVAKEAVGSYSTFPSLLIVKN